MNTVTVIDRNTIIATYAGTANDETSTHVAVLNRSGRLVISGYGTGTSDTVLTDTIIPRLDNAVITIINDMAQVGAPLQDAQVFIDWMNS